MWLRLGVVASTAVLVGALLDTDRARLLNAASAAQQGSQRELDGSPARLEGTGQVSGETIDLGTGARLPGVTIRLRVSGRDEDYTAESDASGHFTLANLPVGRYSIHAELNDWIHDRELGRSAEWFTYGRFRGGPSLPPMEVPTLTLGNGERLTGIRLGLRKFAFIRGHVSDVSNRPVAGVTVALLHPTLIAGRRVLAPNTSTTTTADGAFTFASGPGTFLIGAAVDIKRMEEIDVNLNPPAQAVFRPRFFPDSGSPEEARSITLDWGDDRSNVNLTLPRISGVQIKGTVTGGSTFLWPSYVQLRHADPFAFPLEILVATSYLDNQGHFTLNAVPPGRYDLWACVNDGGRGPCKQANQRVTMGTRQIDGLEVPLSPPLRVSGRVVFDGESQPSADDIRNVRIFLQPVAIEHFGDITPEMGRIEADGRFHSEGERPGRYILTVHGPTRWVLRSAMMGARDLGDSAIDLTAGDIDDVVVTLTDRRVRLQGRVMNADGAPAKNALVIAFPSVEALWTDFGPGRRLEAAASSDAGNYLLGGTARSARLPAGEYYVAALDVTTIPSIGWRDAALLKALVPIAVRVSLVEGETVERDLVLTRAPVAGQR